VRTIALSQDWDIGLDERGNLAIFDGAEALAQDAASAIRLFKGELWFDTRPGVPYFESILGKRPALSFIRARFVAAALRVPGIVRAEVFFTAWEDRKLSGQVQVYDRLGNVGSASF
jgi:hypothetical protein